MSTLYTVNTVNIFQLRENSLVQAIAIGQGPPSLLKNYVARQSSLITLMDRLRLEEIVNSIIE